ncbi:putative RNA recognition motif domain, nucleotide-binding alpha-beta plait domain superfamily [Helianthus annuus]|nr:putative RNA recognition motif domain, nucleotide-binding alpha-beta plait domain superfamily [Helianthus annuus]
MQSDLGKLFVGGIAWDTNEERLQEYFSSFGEVLEAVIMKDHTTGRARGFGFVVFADPAVAERVIKEKHHIDGRMVEAKKAVPREDQSTISRNSGSVQSSPGPNRTRKIFVGGLASTVTESDFRRYFEQFGTITDVVVMYDHNTQRPRGFGFITYDSEEAVDQVLLKTFHELNGKMVEVKRAVPKELSPSPSRAMLGAYHYGLGRASGILNGYTQGPYSPGAVGGYGVRMAGRGGFSPFGSGYGMGLNFEPGLTSPNFNRSLSYGRGMSPNPYFVGNTNRFPGPIGFDGGNGGGNGGNASLFSSNPRNLWGNTGFNYGSNSTGSSAIGGGIFGNAGLNWGSNPITNQGGGNANANASSQSGNVGYGGENGYGLGVGGYGRNVTTSEVQTSSYATANGGFEGPFSDFYVGGSGGGSGGGGGVSNPLYGGDPTWRAGNSDQEGSGSFGGYGIGGGSDVHTRSPPGYVDGYNVSKRQTTRGILE